MAEAKALQRPQAALGLSRLYEGDSLGSERAAWAKGAEGGGEHYASAQACVCVCVCVLGNPFQLVLKGNGRDATF